MVGHMAWAVVISSASHFRPPKYSVSRLVSSLSTLNSQLSTHNPQPTTHNRPDAGERFLRTGCWVDRCGLWGWCLGLKYRGRTTWCVGFRVQGSSHLEGGRTLSGTGGGVEPNTQGAAPYPKPRTPDSKARTPHFTSHTNP